MAREEISRITPLRLVYINLGTGTIDGTTPIGNTPVQLANDPSRRTYLGQPAANMGRLDIWDALAQVTTTEGRLPSEVLRHLGSPVSAWLLKAFGVSTVNASTVETFNMRKGITADAGAFGMDLLVEALPIREVSASTHWAGCRIVLPGAELQFTTDAATEVGNVVELSLYPITEPGAIAAECIELASLSID